MTPSLILDCSITMAWCFAGEETPETAAVQERLEIEAAIVPVHWYLEVANVLALAEKKRRISQADSELFVHLLSAFEIQADDSLTTHAFDDILPLSRTHSLTSYDAAYLELALRTQLPLATLDEELRRAATSLGVTTLGKAP